MEDAERDKKRLRQIAKENKAHFGHVCDQSSGSQCIRGFTLYAM